MPDDDDPLKKQLSFLMELDKLKSVLRQTPLANGTRRENSAEHSWHLAMCALVLSSYAPDGADPQHAIRMLLVHDIVEIDAGDAPIHAPGIDTVAQAKAEVAAAERLFGLLPTEQADGIKALWLEFEAGETPSARFAKALDRLQPLLLNLASDGGTWSENGIGEHQVMASYGPVIEHGAPALWRWARALVHKHFLAR